MPLSIRDRFRLANFSLVVFSTTHGGKPDSPSPHTRIHSTLPVRRLVMRAPARQDRTKEKETVACSVIQELPLVRERS
jgi:hypothetical protein